MSTRPLARLALGISVGESNESARLGFDTEQVNRVTARLLQAVLAQGARVVLGHDWRPGGVMYAVLDCAREYADSWDTESGRLLLNLVPWPDRPRMSPHELERWRPVLEVRPAGLPSRLESQAPADLARDSADYLFLRSAALTHLREQLVEETDARICIGGRTSGYGGRLPGILEEAHLARERSQPLYLAGLLGGASAHLIRAAAPDARLPGRDALQPIRANEAVEAAYRERNEEARPDIEDILRGFGSDFLSLNGLSADENARLFRARTIDEVIAWTLTGLGRVARRPGG